MTTENRIFLAHASEDKPQIRQLYDQLKAKGFSPWLDEVDLVPGQNWREEIPKAIGQAAICLACFSKRSVAKQGYVQKEFRYALSAYAERPPGSIYLIPVRLDGCEVPDLQLRDFELKLKDIHRLDLFEASGFDRLALTIEASLKQKSGMPEDMANLGSHRFVARAMAEYNAILANTRMRLERQRIRFKGEKGYVQSTHVNAKGVRVDVILDNKSLIQDIDALLLEYDP